MPSSRDDFSPQIIEILKKRAAYICSNPKCKKLTIAPSEQSDEKVIYIGKAAHICAASENGPRYDKNMTEEERSSIINAIFLCSNCADAIDKNKGVDFPVDLLKSWKNEHEKWISDNLNKTVQEKSQQFTFNTATSYYQSGGITANQVSIGSLPRAINPESAKVFINEIKEFSSNNIKIRTYFGDAECQNLSSAIKECFESAGWNIKGYEFVIPNTPIRNIGLGVPKSDKESKTALLIYNWLNTNNLKAFAELVSDEDGYIIFVGQNI